MPKQPKHMQVLPFRSLITWMLREYRQTGTVFGVPVYRPAIIQPAAASFSQRRPAIPLGPAAGPHTQLAQNIAAAYAAGGRYFELKTVQVIDGADLVVAKPCILVRDEGYNVEWSSELPISEALAEMVKAWFALHVLAIELNLSAAPDFVFNMSVGYDLAGIRSAKVNTYMDGLIDASTTAIWQECRNVLFDLLPQDDYASLASPTPENVARLQRMQKTDIGQVSPQICSSVTLSTLHGCPSAEIERIARYLLIDKQLDTSVKFNPTLLGYSFVRATLDQMGYHTIQFDDHHFRQDLAFSEAVDLCRRLQAVAAGHGRQFGVKLSNTLPVEIRHQELPGHEMYLSGRALYPLTITLAARLAGALDSQLPTSYCGGVDRFNLEAIARTGLQPITLTTTLLKPGGLARLSQLASLAETALHTPGTPHSGSAETAEMGVSLEGTGLPDRGDYRHGANRPGPDVAALQQLADQAIHNSDYRKQLQRLERARLPRPVPLFNCYLAPCQASCPIGQDVAQYLYLMQQGHDLEALLTIIARNPLPFTTGSFCDHRCMAHCSRQDYDAAINIRGAKLEAARRASRELLDHIKPPVFSGAGKVACLDGSPAGLAAAWFLCRHGIATTVFVAADRLGSPHGGPVSALYQQTLQRDLALLRKGGVRFAEPEAGPAWTERLHAQGYTEILAMQPAAGDSYSLAAQIAAGTRQAAALINRLTGQTLDLTPPVTVDWAGQYPVIIERKGQLQRAGPIESEPGRCLGCPAICTRCVEVCPNRANVAVHVHAPAGQPPDQVLHLDGPCNACGNCATFCPYDSAPYRDKLTLYWQEAAFRADHGAGLYRLAPNQYVVRLAGEVHDLPWPAAPGLTGDLAAVADLIAALEHNQPELLTASPAP